jgi:single-strand DNA-binding protein
MTKGQEIFVEGRLETRSWDDQESGKKMYRTEIILDNFEFGAKPTGAGASQGEYNASNQNAAPANNNQPSTPAPANEEVNIPAPEEIPTIDVDADQEEIKVEDIPF